MGFFQDIIRDSGAGNTGRHQQHESPGTSASPLGSIDGLNTHLIPKTVEHAQANHPQTNIHVPPMEPGSVPQDREEGGGAPLADSTDGASEGHPIPEIGDQLITGGEARGSDDPARTIGPVDHGHDTEVIQSDVEPFVQQGAVPRKALDPSPPEVYMGDVNRAVDRGILPQPASNRHMGAPPVEEKVSTAQGESVKQESSDVSTVVSSIDEVVEHIDHVASFSERSVSVKESPTEAGGLDPLGTLKSTVPSEQFAVSTPGSVQPPRRQTGIIPRAGSDAPLDPPAHRRMKADKNEFDPSRHENRHEVPVKESAPIAKDDDPKGHTGSWESEPSADDAPVVMHGKDPITDHRPAETGTENPASIQATAQSHQQTRVANSKPHPDAQASGYRQPAPQPGSTRAYVPKVQIGQVDIIVSAPPPQTKPAASVTPRQSDLASRLFLRNL